jgi:hypothetical protein
MLVEPIPNGVLDQTFLSARVYSIYSMLWNMVKWHPRSTLCVNVEGVSLSGMGGGIE